MEVLQSAWLPLSPKRVKIRSIRKLKGYIDKLRIHKLLSLFCPNVKNPISHLEIFSSCMTTIIIKYNDS